MSEARRRRIWCFLNTNKPGWMVVLALCEDGHCIASHVSSTEEFARWDIGVTGGDWKHKAYDAHCGAGNWELEWVDNPLGHEGVMAAYALNQRLCEAKNAEKIEENHKLPLVGRMTRVDDGD